MWSKFHLLFTLKAMRKFNPFLTSKNKIFILAFDALMLLVSFLLVYFLRLNVISLDLLFTQPLWIVFPPTLISLYIFGCYDLDAEASPLWMIFKTVLAVLTGLLVVVIFNYIFAIDRQGFFGRSILVGGFLLFGLIAILYRAAAVKFFNSFRADFNWLVLIDNDRLAFFNNDLERRQFMGQVTFLTESSIGQGNGSWDELDTYLDRRWSGVICALKSDVLEGAIGHTLTRAKLLGHNIMGLAQFYELHWSKVPVYSLGPEWFIAADSFNLVHNPIGLRIKRLWDLLLSVILLSLCWPVMLLVALAIRLESRGPVIYRQTRTGKDGRLFTIYKFRSMVQNAEKSGAQWAKRKDSRITKVGQFIRLTRLDELPQLFNVFRGDMSFIGPRPERPEFNEMLEKAIPYYDLRHLVRPGITGWAQVCYPYGASVEDSREKLQYDLYYIKHYSLILDITIVLRTIRVVLGGRGR